MLAICGVLGFTTGLITIIEIEDRETAAIEIL
jgi:hypothetical protein